MSIVTNRSTSAMLALAAMALYPSTVHASADDPWFGRDKALHFAASLGLAAGGYTGCGLAGTARPSRLACGGGLALGAGITKELADLAGLGDPSWRDLAWDAVGTASGLLLAWTIDRLVFGVADPAPTVARPPTQHTALSAPELLRMMRQLEGRGAPRFASEALLPAP